MGHWDAGADVPARRGIGTMWLVLALALVWVVGFGVLGFFVLFMDTIACDSGAPSCTSAATTALLVFGVLMVADPLVAFLLGITAPVDTAAGRRRRLASLLLMIAAPFLALAVNVVILFVGAASAG